MAPKNMPRYLPPVVRDLSRIGADGQTSPEGICSAGGVPYQTCATGTSPPGASGACEAGLGVATDPSCTVGSFALVGCRAGGDA